MKARKHSHKSCNWKLIALFGAIGALDVLFKALAKQVPINQPYPGNGVIDLIHFQNEGIAMSIPVPGSIASITSLVLIAYLGWRLVDKRWRQESAAIIALLIGALSNVIERMTINHVTDYILLFGRSAINLADILIVVGVIQFIRYNKES